jgi:hypothetical protein
VRRLTYGTAACLAGLSLAVAGCGGEADPTAAAAEAKRPSKQEFVASADRLCLKYGERTHAVIDTLPPFEEIAAPDVSRPVMLETAEAAPRIAAAERGLVRELRALDPPSELGSRWDRALDAFQARAVAAEEIAAAGKEGKRTAYLRGFERFQQAGSASTAALADYGFEICATG